MDLNIVMHHHVIGFVCCSTYIARPLCKGIGLFI